MPVKIESDLIWMSYYKNLLVFSLISKEKLSF